ncbi:conserved hypothetical protein [Neospora caninum Liverpool]|uniref:Transmembrane protein n=1 Tax=Neospora caninum (strain Liverpool) TaxID=572307 RepID=F0VPA7_NEOCL|nr:conserved hypothetical protein [Neospora caninum Liverpool]CBZ55553.1 conserved hypothetical protein [Neospora caninum Liverpool]CEL70293.1 TPA: hypothetical protein BN1204_059780 [Neospora caninum Liverpool]|eukprot:XP_003885581.1 conserved hypothetical protein [Neospora caninum Liverpool]
MDGNGEDEYSAGEKEAIFLHPADRPEKDATGISVPNSASNRASKMAGEVRERLVLLSEESPSAERLASDRSGIPDPFPDVQIPATQSPCDASSSSENGGVDIKDPPIFSGGNEIRDTSSGIHPGPGFLSCSISSDSLVYSTSSCPPRQDTDQQNGTSARVSEADSRRSSTSEAPRCMSDSPSPRSPPVFPTTPEERGRNSGSFPSSRPLMPGISNSPRRSEQPLTSSRALETASAEPESQHLSPSMRQPLTTHPGNGADERLVHTSTWVPVGDLSGKKMEYPVESLRLQNLDQLIWRVRLVREVLAGLIGMQAVFSLTSFVFDNAAAGIVALFCMLCSVFAHADRRPASYLLTCLLALALASTVLASLCTRVYGFEPYYVDVTLHRVSIGQIAVLLLVSISTAILTYQTISLQKAQRRKAENSTHGGDQMVLPGVLSNVLLQRGTSNARYILRSAESAAAAAKVEGTVGISIPPALQEEDDEAETNTDCSFDRRESVCVQREGASRLGSTLPPA